MSLILKASVLPKQAEYITSDAPTALYAGGIGAGKTISNVVLAIKLMTDFPGIDLLVCAPTYGMLRDTTMREFVDRCPAQLIEQFNTGIYPECVFYPNHGRRSTARFRSFDDPGKPKGITIGAALIDEVTEMKKEILQEIENRLRQEGMPNYLRMSTNSDETDHYVYLDYVLPVLEGKVTKADIHFITTTSYENFLLPANTIARLRKMAITRPGYHMQKVMGMWGNFKEGNIGAFEETDGFSSAYRVAFIDGSYSDKKATDRTAVSIVAFVPLSGRDNIYWPIEFTGMSWEKSITDPDVIREMLLFLDLHKPIESCLESQLGDSTKVFIDSFREMEKSMGLSVRNHWTWFHQTQNKHQRIMFDVAGNKDRIRVLKGTSSVYLNKVISYVKNAAHEDEIDSLAGGINLWRTSKALAEFIRRLERQKR